MSPRFNRNHGLNLDRNRDLSVAPAPAPLPRPDLNLNLNPIPNPSPFLAFTLLELMVVIVLIGILSASILPVMKGTFEDARLRSTGRELLNVFQLANSRAVTLNEIQRVRIDQANGRYSLESPGREAGAQNGFVPVADLPGGAGTLDSRIAISLSFGSASSTDQTAAEPESSAQPASSTGATALAFNPDGTADACEIRLQDRDGFRLSLQINPVTARVRVRELPRQ